MLRLTGVEAQRLWRRYREEMNAAIMIGTAKTVRHTHMHARANTHLHTHTHTHKLTHAHMHARGNTRTHDLRACPQAREADIDTTEICDFFRFGVKNAAEIYAYQPKSL